MKVSKRSFAIAISIICVIVLSLVMLFLDALNVLNIGFSPVLTFLLFLIGGGGIISLVFAFIDKSPVSFFISAINLGLAIFYIVLIILPNLWWVALITAIAVWMIFVVLSFIFNGFKVDNMGLNNDPNYKTYQQRKAEKGE